MLAYTGVCWRMLTYLRADVDSLSFLNPKSAELCLTSSGMKHASSAYVSHVSGHTSGRTCSGMHHTSAYVSHTSGRRMLMCVSLTCFGMQRGPHVSIRQHMSAYVSICQHMSAYVSIRQHTHSLAHRFGILGAKYSARNETSTSESELSSPEGAGLCRCDLHMPPYVSMRQHTDVCVSIRQHAEFWE
jgi:hypothetical protein